MTHTATNDEHVDLVGEAVEQYFAALEAGERPQLEQFIKRYPKIGDVLRSVIPALQVAEGTTSRETNGEFRTDRQLGDFRILRQIGRGGMGIVYEAEQVSMARRVALKVLPLAGLVDELKIRRFHNEVRAVAALDHPHIVSVYTVSEQHGVHYYAMQLIRGRSLDQVISSLREVRDKGDVLDGHSVSQLTGAGRSDDMADGELELMKPLEDDREQELTQEQIPSRAKTDDSTIPDATRREYFRSVAALGIQTATALEHAHAQGVIHRDIKPANLLLDHSSHLYVTDFGLARVESAAGMTMTGDMVGTLRYMAPEHALATRPVDHRADIYSLGVTLYELLTLLPAYAVTDRQQILKQIAFEEPTSPRRIDSEIPSELETIVMKAMSKDMDERYSSAQDLADDLRRYLENRPIKAKPPTLSQIVTKWSRRNPAIVWASIVTLSLVSLAFGASSVLIAMQRDKAVQSSQELRANLYGSEMNVAYQAWEKGRLTRVHKLLRKWVPQSGETDLRGSEWSFLAALCDDNEAGTMIRFDQKISAVASFLPKDMLFVALKPSPEALPSLQSISLSSPAERIFIDTSNLDRINRLAVSPDGEHLAIGGRVRGEKMPRDFSGKVVVKALAKQTDTVYEIQSAHQIQALGFSPNGQLAGSVTDQGVVTVWDASSGEIRWSEPGHSGITEHVGMQRRLRFSPKSDMLATSVEEGNVVIWAPTDGTKRESSLGPGRKGLSDIAFHPNGDCLLALSRYLDVLRVSDAQSDLSLMPKMNGQPFMIGRSLAISKDARWLAIGKEQNTVEIWDADAGELVGRRSHENAIEYVAFSEDGARLVSASRYAIKVWNAERPGQSFVEKGYFGWWGTALVPLGTTGKVFLAGQGDVANGKIFLWDPNRQIIQTFEGHDETVSWLAASAESRLLASRSNDRFVRIWDIDTVRELHRIPVPRDVFGMAFSPDGRLLVGGDGMSFSGWDPVKGKHLWTVRNGDIRATAAVAFTADGRLVTGDGNWRASGRIRLWDVDASGPTLLNTFEREHDSMVNCLAVSPTGNCIAAGEQIHKIVLYGFDDDENMRQILEPLSGHTTAVRCLAFSPDGRTLVSTGYDGVIKFWNVATGREMGEYTQPETLVCAKFISHPTRGVGFLLGVDQLSGRGRLDVHWLDDRREGAFWRNDAIVPELTPRETAGDSIRMD